MWLLWNPEHIGLVNLVCPGQISKRIKGDYGLSGTQKKIPTFCLDMLLGKSINWFSTLCVLWAACCSVNSCMGAASCSGLMPAASQPEDHTNQGTLLMVTCRPRVLLFGILTVPALASQLQDTQVFQMQSYWRTRENKWYRHQGMKDGTIFEVSPSPHFKD